MNCINLKIKMNRSLYCKKYNKEIKLSDCKNCKLIEYAIKEQTKLKHSKPIKKVSKHRVCVTKDTYLYVYTRDKGKCVICGSNELIQLHHIIYRSQDKSKINDVNNCILLCLKCHELVHSNKNKYQPIMKKILENKYKL